ncbi:MAG: histidine ammonia-lyase [Candidatus Izemoplasmatales bacterium]
MILGNKRLTLEDFIEIVRKNEVVEIADEAKEKVNWSRHIVDQIVEKEIPTYGINTGFGRLSDLAINKTDTTKLQTNLLMSHACGVGEPYSVEIVRGMMLLRVNALLQGHSGIRIEVLEKLVEFLNKQITPVVFEKGSLGASGDLAPLSHMSLPLIGLGEVYFQGTRYPAKEGLKLAGINPLSSLEAKEGLCLINGTQAMASVGALTLYDTIHLFEVSKQSYAMVFEALEGITDVFHPTIHSLRGQPGQITFSKDLNELLEGSKLTTKQGEKRIQDAYSLRCAPQVSGAILDTIHFVKTIIETEMNAVTDNPIIINEDEIISAGNFHGEPLAFAFDYIGIAISEMANIAERRIERLVNSSLSNGLPPFLVAKPGLNSGFMIVQYSAASLVSENKVLAHPASVDSIPSSANQEDHVSMGSISTRKASSILDNTRKVIAMELFASAQAIDFRNPSLLAKKTKIVYDKIRDIVPFIQCDDVMYPHIQKIEQLIKNEVI